MRFDVDEFEERAAIRQFDGGQSRFEAETGAAREQGVERWQALKMIKEASDAQRGGNSAISGDRSGPMEGERGSMHLPGMQPSSEEKDRSMPERIAQAGWSGVALLALLVQGGGVL